MKTYVSRSEMDDRMVATLRQMMESHAYRELAAAQMFGAGLQFVPELKRLKFLTWHIREETEHYECVVRMYEDFTGEDVQPRVHARLAGRPVPLPVSWFDLAMAQFLYDRGGYWQLLEYEECAFLPYREVVRKILKEEAGHQGLGQRIVLDLCASGAYEDVKQVIFEKWLAQGMLSFGRPRTPGGSYAVDVGLKKHDSGEVMRAFIDDIKPVVRACGLYFPRLRALGLETPDDLDLWGE